MLCVMCSLTGFYACKIFAPVVTEYAMIILSFGIKSICFKSNCIIVSIIHAWQQHAVCADIVYLHYDNSPMQGELKCNVFLDRFPRCKIFCARRHGITVMTLIILMCLFYEDNIFSTSTNFTYGPWWKTYHTVQYHTIYTLYTLRC